MKKIKKFFHFILAYFYSDEISEINLYTKYLVPAKYKNDIGDFTYGKIKLLDWGEGAKLKIGKFCSIADGTTILLGGEHKTDWVTTYPFPVLSKYWPKAKNIKGYPITKGDIVIGNDVWIGINVTILSGVKIGDGAVIGAGSLVIKDIEPYTIAFGVPAKPIRKRFEEAEIKKLLKIKWWDWSNEKIKQNIENICSNNISNFIKTFN